MRLLPLAAVALGVAVLGLATPLAAAQTGAEGAARTHPFFPDHGTLNALVLFVQHRDDAFEDCHDRTRVVEEDGRMFHPQIDDAVCHSGPDVPEATSWTDDEATEWPVYWSTGEAGPRLPQYAADGWLAPPGTPPSGYAEGSLSQYYHLNSGGRFELHGYVYPEVYIPQHDRATYRDHPQPFANGGLRLSHEILSSPGIQAFVEAIPDAHLVFDRYRNGTNLTLEDLGDDARDGLFDLIVMVFRSNRPCRVGTYVGRGGRCLQPTASGSSSLGSDKVYLVANGFAPSPLFLGGLEVVDNFRTGSGVWSAGGDARTAVTLTAHEIGHRQLYYQHSDENSYSVMVGSGARRLGMFGAAERVQLGWATARTVDLDALADSVTAVTLGDTFETGEVLLVEDSTAAVVTFLQARTHGNVWDRPPDGRYADGDAIDLHLPVPGLLLSQARRAGAGFSPASVSFENHGLPERKCFFDAEGLQQCALTGGYPFAFSPGDAFGPRSRFPSVPAARDGLGGRLAVTDIAPSGSGFSFTLWRDLPTGAASEHAQTD